MVTLTNLLFMVAFLTVFSMKYMFEAFEARHPNYQATRLISQRLRYSIVVFWLLICAPFSYYLLIANGWAAYSAGIAAWWSIPVIGWVSAILIYVSLASPLLALLTIWGIYRKPTRVAFITGGTDHILTMDKRDKRQRRKPIYVRDGNGLLRRTGALL